MDSTFTLQGDIRQARKGDRQRILHPFSIPRASNEHIQITLDVSTGTDAQAISFGGIEHVRMVAAFSTEQVELHINGSGMDPVAFKDFFATAVGTTDSDAITSLHISNNSGSSASVTIFIVGSNPDC